MNYIEFLENKTQLSGEWGFEPTYLPDCLYDWQAYLVRWALLKGRAALFEDCGLGKTLQMLVWAQNVVQHENKPVLILTPLAVATQTVSEGEKFGINVVRSKDGKYPKGARIVVTNYDRLHYFDAKEFAGCVCDESSILKNYEGATKATVTDFMRKMKYRLLASATAAPNDYIELGTSAEALGVMGYIDMLKMFFKNDTNTTAQGGLAQKRMDGKYRFRGHSEREFWRWVCSWARAVQKPSDVGFDDGKYMLPPLITNQHVVKASISNPDYLFDMPAKGLAEQRAERRRSITDRCEIAASIISSRTEPSIAWCHLNDEGNLLTDMITDSVQVSGSDSDEVKEERFAAFESGQIRVLVSKPKIAGLGLNWQHCNHQTFFPSHSFEQWYQAIRRCWRFGQTKPVTIDVISSEGEVDVLKNLKRKSEQADKMFSMLVELMNNELKIKITDKNTKPITIPSWL